MVGFCKRFEPRDLYGTGLDLLKRLPQDSLETAIKTLLPAF